MKCLFLITIPLWVVFAFNGCNTKQKVKCPKPKIQIADMTNQYKECKGMKYEKTHDTQTIGN